MAFGVYIHFPYCTERCPYCDFAVAVRKTIRHDRYLEAMRNELSAKAPLFAGRRAVSIYFGGGTPSLWRPDCIAAAIADVRRHFPAPSGAAEEITLECDPAELTESALCELRAAGINRLSIGAQSFSRHHLRVLGRRHGPEQIAELVAAARRAGFDNISLDLMIGLLAQKQRELDDDLNALLSLSPEHVSLYQLTVEPRTMLGAQVRRGVQSAPDPEAQAAAYERVCAVLATHGFRHYEISSFARQAPDGTALHARHNSLYWTGGEYLGLGMGAHSFRRGDSAQRFANARGLDDYLGLWGKSDAPRSFALDEGAPGLSLYEALPRAAFQREAVWLALRRIEGFSRRAFHSEFGIDPCDEYAAAVTAMQARGWLELSGDTLRLTPSGLLFADEVGAAFL